MPQKLGVRDAHVGYERDDFATTKCRTRELPGAVTELSHV